MSDLASKTIRAQYNVPEEINKEIVANQELSD